MELEEDCLCQVPCWALLDCPTGGILWPLFIFSWILLMYYLIQCNSGSCFTLLVVISVNIWWKCIAKLIVLVCEKWNPKDYTCSLLIMLDRWSRARQVCSWGIDLHVEQDKPLISKETLVITSNDRGSLLNIKVSCFFFWLSFWLQHCCVEHAKYVSFINVFIKSWVLQNCTPHIFLLVFSFKQSPSFTKQFVIHCFKVWVCLKQRLGLIN